MGQKNSNESNKTLFTPEAIDTEIKVWETIKSYGFSEKSIIFYKTINIDNILEQLYKAKNDHKILEIETRSLYINYFSEEEKRQFEEMIRSGEEERKKKGTNK